MKIKLSHIIFTLLWFSLVSFSQEDIKMIMPIGHTLKINKIIELNNVDFLASCADDFTCKIWGKRTGKLIANLNGHSNRITSLEYSNLTNEIITGGIDSLICFWKISAEGIKLKSIKTSDVVNSFSLDSINQILYVLEGQNIVSSWDVKNHKRISQFTYKKSYFASIKYDYYTKSVIILSWNGIVYIKSNPITKEILKRKAHNNYVNNIEFGNNQLMYTSSWDGDIIKWRQSDNTILQKYNLSSKIINEFKLVNHDSIILAATFQKKLIVYNLAKNSFEKDFDFDDWVMGVTINDSQTTAAIISKDGYIKLLELKSFTIIKTKKLNQNLESCRYINNSKDLLCTFSNGTAIVLESNLLIYKFELENKNVVPSNFIINHDGSIVLANQNDDSYSFWDIKRGIFINKESFENGIIDIDYPNKEGDLLMAFGNTLKLHKKNGNYFSTQKTFEKDLIIKAGFSHSGKTPFVITRDFGLFILNETSLDPIEKYSRIDYSYLVSIEFASDDSVIIVGDTEGNITIYNRPKKEGKFLNIDNENGEIIYIKEIESNVVCVISRNVISLVDLKTNSIIKSEKVKQIISDAKFHNNQLYISHFNGIIEICNLNNFKLENKFNTEFSSINITTSEKLFFNTTIDGQIFCKNINNLKNKFILSVLKSGNYIIKLPDSKYYMCSKEASKMLHYVTPNLKVIGFDQLDPIYNRPDIVLDSIGKYFGEVDPQLLARYRSAWEKRIDRLGLDKEKLGKGEISVPEAEIIGADEIAYENKEGKLKIKVLAKDPIYQLSRFNVYVNEVPLYGSAGISIAFLKKNVWDTTIALNLSLGENKIQVSVMNELGLENLKYSTYVNYIPEKNDIVTRTYFIGIGVDDFKQEKINNKSTKLNYCVKDVNDLSKLFSEDPSSNVKLYTNEQVNKENILSIKKFLLENTTVNDRVIISCSSHGLLDNKNNFYLAMHDVDFKNPSYRGLAYEELENLLDGIPARKKLLLLDACNSGENELLEKNNQLSQNSKKNNDAPLVNARTITSERSIGTVTKSSFQEMNELFINVRNNTGSVIISAAGGQQSALEGNAVIVDGNAIDNGAFTYSVLEYLKKNKKNIEKLTVNQLKKYVEDRVVEITKGKQEPTSRQETMEVDWGLK